MHFPSFTIGETRIIVELYSFTQRESINRSIGICAPTFSNGRKNMRNVFYIDLYQPLIHLVGNVIRYGIGNRMREKRNIFIILAYVERSPVNAAALCLTMVIFSRITAGSNQCNTTNKKELFH